MELEQCIVKLASQAEIIHSLIKGVAGDQARWKPDPNSWSILEVINHLYDEEREDFRAHLVFILEQPDHPWTRIDPQDWVLNRQYNKRDLSESMNNFLEERQNSLAWLKTLSSPDWDTEGLAPFGMITAGDMTASWLAHDLLHIRQLVELRWSYLIRSVEPYRVQYAGEW